MTKPRSNLFDRLIHTLFGVEVLDEYSRQQVNAIGNTCFMMFFAGSLLTIFLAPILRTIDLTLTFHVLLLSQVVLLLVTALYMSKTCHKLGLLNIEVLAQDYEAVKAQRLKRHRRNAWVFFLFQILTQGLWEVGLQFPHLMTELMRPEELIRAALLSLLFYHFTKKQLLSTIMVLDED